MYQLTEIEEKNILILYLFADRASRIIRRQQTRSFTALQDELLAFISKYAESEGISEQQAKRVLTDKALKEYRFRQSQHLVSANKKGLSTRYINFVKREITNPKVTLPSALVGLAQYELEIIRYTKEIETKKAVKYIYEYQRSYTNYQITTRADIKQITFPEFDKLSKPKALVPTSKDSLVKLTVQKIDQKRIDAILNEKWADGLSFDARILRDDKRLLAELQNELTYSIRTGEPLDRAVKRFAETAEMDKHNAKRILYTESSRVASKAEEDSYHDFGITKYRFMATLDEKTCPVCGGLDGQVFDVSKMQVGVNAAPMHPLCRCTTVPILPIELQTRTRAARSSMTGKSINIPYSEYDDWK